MLNRAKLSSRIYSDDYRARMKVAPKLRREREALLKV